MQLVKDILVAFVIPGLCIFGFCFILVRLSLWVRKRGGTYTHVVYGATNEMLNKDQRKAAKVIVNKNAKIKDEEQESGEDF